MGPLFAVMFLVCSSVAITGQTVFNFDTTANATNSVEETGVRLSGAVTVGSNTISVFFDNHGDEASYTEGIFSQFGFHLPSTIDDNDVTKWSPNSFEPITDHNWTESAQPSGGLWKDSQGENYFGAVADSPASGANHNGLIGGEAGTFVFTYTGTVAAGITGTFQGDIVNHWLNTSGTRTGGDNPTINDYDFLTRWVSVDTTADSNPFGNPSEKLGIELNVIPEPSTYALIIGTACLGFVVWKRKANKARDRTY